MRRLALVAQLPKSLILLRDAKDWAWKKDPSLRRQELFVGDGLAEVCQYDFADFKFYLSLSLYVCVGPFSFYHSSITTMTQLDMFLKQSYATVVCRILLTYILRNENVGELLSWQWGIGWGKSICLPLLIFSSRKVGFLLIECTVLGNFEFNESSISIMLLVSCIALDFICTLCSGLSLWIIYFDLSNHYVGFLFGNGYRSQLGLGVLEAFSTQCWMTSWTLCLKL